MHGDSRFRARLERRGHPLQAWNERIREEVAFARALGRLHPDLAPSWQPLIREAERCALSAAGDGDTAFERAVREAEALLEPVGRVAKTYVFHGVGHAHIDMNWMWSWQETVSVTLDTFRTVLRLLEEYPEFHFSQSQASCYRIVEQFDPAMLTRIQRYVTEGRWEVLASHWVENDANMAGPEALCQHLRLTRAYMAELFNLTPADIPVNWAPDTFGHAARGPSYLVRGGVRYQYLHRPGAFTSKPRRAFRWRDPADGSTVLVWNAEDIGYNGRLGPELAKPLLDFAVETGLREWLVCYGIGDHGGGPTRRDLERVRDLSDWPVFPKIRLGRARDYFEWLDREGTELPVIAGELATCCAGCYTSQSIIKRNNRIAENRLSDAQIAVACAGGAARRFDPDAAPPRPLALRDAWRDTLFAHFHDILPGSGVHDTRVHQCGLFQHVMAIATRTETDALRAFAEHVALVDTPAEASMREPSLVVHDALGSGVGNGAATGLLAGPGPAAGSDGVRRFVAFNPTARNRTEVVELTVWDSGEGPSCQPLQQRSWHLVTADHPGRRIPGQVLRHGHYWGHAFATLAFPLRTPSFGYLALSVHDTEGEAPVADSCARLTGAEPNCSYLPPENAVEGVENAFLSLEIDPVTGGLRRLRDKRSGLDLAGAPGLPALEFATEIPHRMSAWTLGPMSPLEPVKVFAVRRARSGPWVAAVEVDLRFGASRFTMTYELRAGEPFLRMSLKGNWVEHGSPETGIPNLRWRLATRLSGAKASYEIPFGSIERPYDCGEEVPGLEWVAVQGRSGDDDAARLAGLIVTNDSKYGYSLDGGDLRLSLIRSSYDPDPLPETGEHEINWRIAPFTGVLDHDLAFQTARELTHAVRFAPVEPVGNNAPVVGHWPSGGRFMRWTGAELCGLEPSEDGRGLWAKAYETMGRDGVWRLDFTDSPLGKPRRVERIDLNGHTLGTVETTGFVVEIPLKAYDIAAIRMEFDG